MPVAQGEKSGFDLEGALESCENGAELAENNAVEITAIDEPTTNTREGFTSIGSQDLDVVVCRSLSGCDEPVAVSATRPMRRPSLRRSSPLRR